MDNMKIYETARVVPDNAKKAISAGRLKGMTDINPMWRIKKLTEMFGPCGIGWWYDIVKEEIVYDELTNQKAAFVDILLYYKNPENGEASKGIPGTGGSSFVSQERNGAYLSDECFKMALTDAISVSAKSIGIGADVYFDKDRTKYSQPTVSQNPAPVSMVDQSAYEAAINAAKELLAAVTDAATANQAMPVFQGISHAGDSRNDCNRLWNQHMKKLGLFYDRVLKQYTAQG